MGSQPCTVASGSHPFAQHVHRADGIHGLHTPARQPWGAPATHPEDLRARVQQGGPRDGAWAELAWAHSCPWQGDRGSQG